ncbi:MAG: 4-(cytidine 5'-diphospho)-2-C-methyl-D-erythritol kinase [Patescibacteria group bacterium]|nr:4-(cytidine 5'-diphospho)-2-C-methyl-D-erythritol kinase [Patescibacteria group bacterium]
MKIKSPAKINLALDVLGKDKNGYHFIQTILHEIDLHDVVTLTEMTKGIEIECADPEVPCNSTNTTYRAAALLRQKFRIKQGVHIHIEKKIPTQSGLGGASSNAAAVLKGLNKLWSLELTADELAKLGAKIGTDTPFFIYGGTALGEHYGEKITPLPHIQGLKIDLKLSGKRVSTKKAYDKLDLKNCGKNAAKTKAMLEAIRAGDLKEIIKNVHNDFQQKPVPPYLAGSGSAQFNIQLSPAKP